MKFIPIPNSVKIEFRDTLLIHAIASMKYYAVAKGRQTGIFHTWQSCKKQVHGFQGSVFKSFDNEAEAVRFCGKVSDTAISKITVKTACSKSTGDGNPLVNPQKPVETNIAPVVVNKKESSPPVVVYTDGACFGNGQNKAKAGVGVFFGLGDRRNISEPLPKTDGLVPTNNRAEMQVFFNLM